MKITVQDFTGIYNHQPFMQELRKKANDSADIQWLDCTKIVGTDCYCDDDAIKEINDLIDSANQESSNSAESNTKSRPHDINCKSIPEIHFFDNGNYHYMSKLWTDRVQEPFSLVVFDHHPDMQPPRFGGILSCGGWVKEVLNSNKFIQNVIIIGVKDELVETIHNELLQSGEASILNKVTFIKESEITSKEILDQIGNNKALSSFSQSELLALSLVDIKRESLTVPSIYISIDKDALAPAYAATNWDQGSLSTESLKATITSLAASHKILGIDICGERARDFDGNEFYTVQEADALNNILNRELVEFFSAAY